MFKRNKISVFGSGLLIFLISRSIFADAVPLPATESIFTCQARMGNIPKIAFNELDNTTISKILGWVKDPKANNVCGGYYIDPAIVLATPNPKPIKEELISVSAKNPSFFFRSMANRCYKAM